MHPCMYVYMHARIESIHGWKDFCIRTSNACMLLCYVVLCYVMYVRMCIARWEQAERQTQTEQIASGVLRLHGLP